VPFRAYGVNNSNNTTWRKVVMIILVKGEEVDGVGVVIQIL
jgi:hypothetical protein